MQLKAVQTLGGDTIVKDDLTLVVISDRHGNPLAVACELSPGMYEVSKVGDPDFAAALKMLGVDKTVVVTTVQAPAPRRGDRLLLGPRG